MCTHHIYPYCGFPGEKYRVFGIHLLCGSNVPFVNLSLKLALFAFKGLQVLGKLKGVRTGQLSANDM